MAGEIHGADDVRDTHTHAHATFRSPNLGPLGIVTDARVHVTRTRAPARLPHVPEHATLPIPIIPVALDEPPSTVPDDARAVVVEATGSGNTPLAHLELARALIERGVAVALTTRCPSGRPLPGYGFPGGSSGWWEAGALFSGTLDALKTRVLLALGLGAGLERRELAALLVMYGGGARD
jgi:L-asparaginase